MSFVQRELEKINEAIRQTPNDDSKADCLRIAQQALAWALDPDTTASPSKYLNKFHGSTMAPTEGTGVGFTRTPSNPGPRGDATLA